MLYDLCFVGIDQQTLLWNVQAFSNQVGCLLGDLKFLGIQHQTLLGDVGCFGNEVRLLLIDQLGLCSDLDQFSTGFVDLLLSQEDLLCKQLGFEIGLFLGEQKLQSSLHHLGQRAQIDRGVLCTLDAVLVELRFEVSLVGSHQNIKNTRAFKGGLSQVCYCNCRHRSIQAGVLLSRWLWPWLGVEPVHAALQESEEASLQWQTL